MDILIGQYRLFNYDNIIPDKICHDNIMIYDKIDYNQLNNIEYINFFDIEFRYDHNNFRIPYYKNNQIKAIKINIDEIYNYISSASLIPDTEIISGEKIQYFADIVIGNPSSLSFNPNNRLFSKKIDSIQSINDISIYKSIFVFTHDLEDFYNKFDNQLQDKIIISHNSDHEISIIKNVKLHIAQNCLINDHKLLSIPIGIENSQWFDHSIFHKIRKLNISKKKNIYFFFNLNTHNTRQECYNILQSKLEWNNNKNKEEYFKELATHKYAVCPRGNGIDTHRIWECLYLNVIPIIISKDYINIDNLPIIILNDWSFLNCNILNKIQFSNQQYNKLLLFFYNKYII